MKKSVAVYDFETHNWTEKVLLIGFKSESVTKFFNTIPLFLDYILMNAKNHFIYAHNGGRFDVLFLVDELIKCNIDFTVISLQSSVYKLQLHKYGITFIDSYHTFKGSLEKIAEIWELPYRKTAIDYDNILNVPVNELKDYLKNDLDILFSLIMKYYEIEKSFPSTIASLSLKTFKKYYDIQKIVKPTKNKFFREKFYSGGRVEIFKRVEKNINVYDVNSLYPMAMTGVFPIGEFYKTIKKEKQKIGFCEIRILKDTDIYIPPINYKTDKHVLFPNFMKNDIVFCNTLDLENLEFHNIKFNVIAYYYSDKYDNLFDEYVYKYYELKAKSKGAERELIKAKLTHLYGKFAQKQEFSTIKNFIPYNHDNMKIQFWDIKRNLFQITTELDLSNSIYTIASLITGKARHLLYDYFKQIDFDVVYCDTDSIFTTEKFKTDNLLGGLKQEFKNVNFYGILPKFYALTEKQKIVKQVNKGFSKNLDLSVTDYKNAIYKDCYDNFFEEIKILTTFKGLKHNKFEMRKQVKQLNTHFTKRCLINKIETRAFNTKELEL